MKTTLGLVVLFILVLGGGYAYYTHTQSTYSVSTPTTSVPTAADIASPAMPVNTTSPTTTPSSTTTVFTSYTLADVATHSTSSDCWTTIDGGVFDLTTWITKHPGGQEHILSICGKDGSSAFNGQHGTDKRAIQTLATFKVGVLAS